MNLIRLIVAIVLAAIAGMATSGCATTGFGDKCTREAATKCAAPCYACIQAARKDCKP